MCSATGALKDWAEIFEPVVIHALGVVDKVVGHRMIWNSTHNIAFCTFQPSSYESATGWTLRFGRNIPPMRMAHLGRENGRSWKRSA
jgi:hypothetical protein